MPMGSKELISNRRKIEETSRFLKMDVIYNGSFHHKNNTQITSKTLRTLKDDCSHLLTREACNKLVVRGQNSIGNHMYLVRY